MAKHLIVISEDALVYEDLEREGKVERRGEELHQALDEVLPELDVAYMLRIQMERAERREANALHGRKNRSRLS